jgi:hypothetical protein
MIQGDTHLKGLTIPKPLSGSQATTIKIMAHADDIAVIL